VVEKQSTANGVWVGLSTTVTTVVWELVSVSVVMLKIEEATETIGGPP
jgi:hypothetical protein